MKLSLGLGINKVKGMLKEDSSTNIALWSEDFSNAVWFKTNSSIITNDTTSHNGETTADRITNDSGTQAYVRQTITTTSGLDYALSAYVKKGNTDWCFLRHLGVSGSPVAYFDLTNGVVGNVGAGITAKIQYLGNDWYRCSVVGETGTTSSLVDIGVADADQDNRTSDLNDYIFIDRAQFETPKLTSYIKTEGSAVTRP